LSASGPTDSPKGKLTPFHSGCRKLQVESLLGQDEPATGIVDRPADELALTEATLTPSAQLGRHNIEAFFGRGGTGTRTERWNDLDTIQV